MSIAPNSTKKISLNGNELTFDQLYRVALYGDTVSLSPAAVERMNSSRAVVDHLVASGATAYGINTGFGKLASVRISAEQVRTLQVNLCTLALLRRWGATSSNRDARDDAAPRECSRQRVKRECVHWSSRRSAPCSMREFIR